MISQCTTVHITITFEQTPLPFALFYLAAEPDEGNYWQDPVSNK